MLGKLIGPFARRGKEPTEHPPSSTKKFETSLRVSQSANQHHSRLYNDSGNDDLTAPPSMTVKLKSAKKTPQEISANAGEKLSEMDEIWTITHDHYKAMGETENGLAKAEKIKTPLLKANQRPLPTYFRGLNFPQWLITPPVF